MANSSGLKLSLIGIVFLCQSTVSYAQNVPSAPYDDRLNRLAEVLGSVHYLRNLCDDPSNEWRDQMQTLLGVEKPEPARRARLIASFNRGYRSFNSVYTACTDRARASADEYVAEGVALTKEISSRYEQ